MKGAIYNHLILVIVIVSVLAHVIWVSPVEGSPGDDYLNEKEDEVTLLQTQVEDNHRRQCELLASCDTPGNCSRMACWPLVDDSKRTTCQEVQINSYCPAPNSNGAPCPSKKFDFTKLYVRLAPMTDITAAETATTVCSQRELSSVFKALINSTSLSQAFMGTVFMGSVDGTYMHYPGSDLSVQDCRTYDPRSRPWYRTSTSVAKAVMVLLDVGASMGNPIPTPLQGTYFTTASAIVLQLLNTLSEQDYVNIITFDSSKATSLAPSPVRVQYQNTGNSSYHPEFDGLKANLSTLNLENLQRPSNISLGIAEALSNYALGFPMSMKIIMVFTDGNAANLKDGALAALSGMNGTKVFIFKLPQPDDVANRFLAGSPFLTQLRNMGGSFNVLTSEAVNPLYSIQAYFSFLANFRASMKNSSSADYSIIYEDFEHVVGNIFAITKPAFDDDGKLLGVVGLKIFVNELGYLTDFVKEALLPRTLEKTFDPTKIVLTAANASIQVDNNPVLPCPTITTPLNAGLCAKTDTVDNNPVLPCPTITTPLNAGLCAKTDTVSTIQDLACCNACTTHTKANSRPKYIGIGVNVGVVAIAAIILLLVCFRIPPFPLKEAQFFSQYKGPEDPADIN